VIFAVYSLDSLNKFPVIKKMFMEFEFHSAIPSPAPVERLFSYAGMVLTRKRRSMTDNFEQQLLPKGNRHMILN